MKYVINYFYKFNIDNIRMIDNNYYFNYKNSNFVFYEVKDTYFDQYAAFELNAILLKHNNNFYQIIPNKNNEILTYTSNKKYILMLDNFNQDRNFDYYDIIDTNIPVSDNNKIINRLNRFNWDVMWKNKVDHFEVFINHNINKYPQLNEYYNYFIGLAENAIMYFKDTTNEEKISVYDKLVISHKRIEDNTTFKHLYNPIGLIIDHPSRDLAGYLKTIFWNKTYKIDEIKQYLNDVILSGYGARMLISRMLFPSFFFDSFENLIDNKLEIKDIIRTVDRMGEYECYVFNIQKIIRNKYAIPEIEWIKKVDYSSTLTTPNTSGTSFISIDSMPSLSVTSIILQ